MSLEFKCPNKKDSQQLMNDHYSEICRLKNEVTVGQ